MTLANLMENVFDCYVGIDLKNAEGETVTAFDDDNPNDDEEKLQKVLKEFGDCEVSYITACAECYLYITVQAEYEEIL